MLSMLLRCHLPNRLTSVDQKDGDDAQLKMI